MGGLRGEFIAKISIQCWSSSRVHARYYAFPLYINSDLRDDVIYNTAISADDRTLYFNGD